MELGEIITLHVLFAKYNSQGLCVLGTGKGFKGDAV